jgi:hydrogenase 3 maturation protease
MKDYLESHMKGGRKYAIMGVGSALRSDDAAGLYLISLLKPLARRPDVLLVSGSTAPENFTGVIKAFQPDKLFIIDAAHMGLKPGETRGISAGDIALCSLTTHMLPLPVMMKYLENEIDCEMILIGIQPGDTSQGLQISRIVRKGVRRLADDFLDVFGVLFDKAGSLC